MSYSKVRLEFTHDNRAARIDQELPRLEHLYLSELMATRDAVEGIRSFLEKRAPPWSSAGAAAR